MSVYVAKVHSKLTFPNSYALSSFISWVMILDGYKYFIWCNYYESLTLYLQFNYTNVIIQIQS